MNLGTGVGTVALGESGLTRRRGLRAAVTLLFLHYWLFCTAECVLRLDGLCHSFQPFLKSRTSRFLLSWGEQEAVMKTSGKRGTISFPPPHSSQMCSQHTQLTHTHTRSPHVCTRAQFTHPFTHQHTSHTHAHSSHMHTTHTAHTCIHIAHTRAHCTRSSHTCTPYTQLTRAHTAHTHAHTRTNIQETSKPNISKPNTIQASRRIS